MGHQKKMCSSSVQQLRTTHIYMYSRLPLVSVNMMGAMEEVRGRSIKNDNVRQTVEIQM